MAAEALEKKAAELGYTIKVETRGSSGVKNVVTDEEIANAVGIIVAADTKVPMERFNGKKVIECKVADGINKSEELINRIMGGDAKEYHAQEGASEEKESKNSGIIGHQIYTHLMNGVSHMLPFVIGGGILAGFLAGFIVLMLKKAFSKLPASLDGIKPTLIYPLLGILIISILMCFIFNPLIGLINTGLSDMLTSISDAGFITVLGLILGAMMAIDMGGPINKAAYVFGSGMLATAAQMMTDGASSSDPAVQACYIAMASIMVGGMVPPVGITLACRFFPKKFTAAERNSWVSNLIMGCSFITEGAIPFAAADPIHVIPCTLVGAGVAGFLSALFKCTLMAPHGGIFVFATVGNPLLYIVSWLIGSVVTALLLGLIKKDAQ